MTLDEKISPILKKNRLTKDEMIAKLGISKSTFFLWMKQSIEKRTIEELEMICKILSISVNEILDIKTYQPSNQNNADNNESISLYKKLVEYQEEIIKNLKSKNNADKS